MLSGCSVDQKTMCQGILSGRDFPVASHRTLSVRCHCCAHTLVSHTILLHHRFIIAFVLFLQSIRQYILFRSSLGVTSAHNGSAKMMSL